MPRHLDLARLGIQYGLKQRGCISRKFQYGHSSHTSIIIDYVAGSPRISAAYLPHLFGEIRPFTILSIYLSYINTSNKAYNAMIH